MSNIFDQEEDRSPPPGFKKVTGNQATMNWAVTTPEKTPEGFEKIDHPIYESLMPKDPDARKMIDYMIANAENPNEEEAKISNALYMSKKWGYSLEDAYNRQDEIIQWYTGKEKSAFEFAGIIGKGFEGGLYTVAIAGLRAKQYKELLSTGIMNQDITNQINELKKKRPSYDAMKEAVPVQALTWAAEQLPIWIGGAKRGMEIGVPMGIAAAGAALVGGQLGPQIAFPEEPVTMSSAFVTMFSVGMTYGVLENIAKMEFGISWDDMLEEGIDPHIGGAVSVGVSAINTGLEMLQLKGLLAPFKKAISKTTSTIIKSGVLKSLAKSLAKKTPQIIKGLAPAVKGFAKGVGSYGVSTIKEAFQEVTQESVNITFTELAKHWQNAANDAGIPVAEADKTFKQFKQLAYTNAEEVGLRLGQTFYQSLLSFGVMGGPGGIMETVSNVQTGKQEAAIKKQKAANSKSISSTGESISGKIEGKEEAVVEKRVVSEEKQAERAGKLRETVAKTQAGIQENIEYYEKIIAKNPDKKDSKTYSDYVKDIQEAKVKLDDLSTRMEGESIDIESALKETEAQIQEYEGIIKDVLPESKKDLSSFLENSPFSLAKMGLQWFAEKDLSKVWSNAAEKLSKNESLSDTEINRLMKDIKNNPRKFQKVFAELLGKADVTEAIGKIEALEVQENDIIAKAGKNKGVKATVKLKNEIREATKIAKRLELAKEVKNPKEKLAILTGKHKIGDLFTEEIGEKAIKATPGIVKQALTEGKNIGVKKERIRKKALLDKAATKKKMQAYVRGLARKISKKPAKTIDYFYRKAIEAIQAGIDPNFRQNKTLQGREKLKTFLEENPEVRKEISSKVLASLEKKPLNDMTVAELEDILSEVEILTQLGRLKKRLKKNQETKAFIEKRDKFVDIITRSKGLIEQKAIGSKDTDSFWKKMFKKIVGGQLNVLNPPRMVDMFDGGKSFHGPMHDYLINAPNDVRAAELVQIDRRKDNVKKKQKELKIKTESLFKMIKIEGFEKEYSTDQVMDIYAGMQNEHKRYRLIHGNELTEDQAYAYISKLTMEQKALTDFIIDEYGENYSRLKTAHILYTDEDLGNEGRYTPNISADMGYDGMKVDIAQELAERMAFKKAYANKNFTKLRTWNKKPLELGLMSTWEGQVAKQEHYIAGAETIKKMQRMVNDKEFMAALRQTYGNEAVRLIQSYVNRVANPNIYKTFDSISKVSRIAREHIAIAYLAYNGVTIFKQLPSVLMYAPYSGVGNLVASTFNFGRNPMKIIEFVEKMDPQMKHRTLERWTEELKLAGKSKYERVVKKIGKTGVVGLYFMDKVATTIGWMAVYNKNLNKLGEVGAAQEARNVTLRTQPASQAKDIAQIYTSAALSWMLMFTKQLNQIYGILTYDLPMQIKNKKIGQAICTVSSLGISALMIWAFSNRRLPEDDEDIKDALLDQSLSAIPIIGKELNGSRTGWINTGIPGLSNIAALGGLPLIKSDERKMEKSLEAISIFLGLPYTGAHRVHKAIKEQDPLELIGGVREKK